MHRAKCTSDAVLWSDNGCCTCSLLVSVIKFIAKHEDVRSVFCIILKEDILAVCWHTGTLKTVQSRVKKHEVHSVKVKTEDKLYTFLFFACKMT